MVEPTTTLDGDVLEMLDGNDDDESAEDDWGDEFAVSLSRYFLSTQPH